MPIYHGRGVINSLINKLPFELHVPGYQYCGPGTKLDKRLARGDSGINPLDAACKQHDIAYSQHKNLSGRHRADKQLEEAAWHRVKSKDASFGEKAAAWAVTNAMKVKRKSGMGYKKVALRSGVVMKARKALGRFRNKIKKNGANRSIIREGSNIALAAARAAVKHAGGRGKIRTPRVIPVPKSGGILPIIPIMAGLSAIGSLIGGSSAVAKAVNDSKTAHKKLEESERHNKTMEAIALGKKGSGLYLKPYKSGLGLYLHPAPKNY